MVKGFNKGLSFLNRELWRLGRLANSPWSNRWGVAWHLRVFQLTWEKQQKDAAGLMVSPKYHRVLSTGPASLGHCKYAGRTN